MASPEAAWVPLSERAPMEKDAINKMIWVWEPDSARGPRPIREAHYTNVGMFKETHWMTPIPLPPLPVETEEGTDPLVVAQRLIRRAVYAAEYLRDKRADEGAVEWLADADKFLNSTKTSSHD